MVGLSKGSVAGLLGASLAVMKATVVDAALYSAESLEPPLLQLFAGTREVAPIVAAVVAADVEPVVAVVVAAQTAAVVDVARNDVAEFVVVAGSDVAGSDVGYAVAASGASAVVVEFAVPDAAGSSAVVVVAARHEEWQPVAPDSLVQLQTVDPDV